MSGPPPSIADALVAEGGRVAFARFMELALTDPQAGYYASRARILGPRGDFSTAPRLAPAFNRMMADLVTEVVDAVGDAPVLVAEAGPGEGDLAAAMVAHWDAGRPDLRDRVVLRLTDVGGAFTDAQERVVAEMTAAGWDAARAPGPPGCEGLGLRRTPVAAVVFSNELLDALPVHRVDVSGDRPRECFVRFDGDSFTEEWDDVSEACARELTLLFGDAGVASLRRCSRDGRIELRPAVGEFVAGWAAAFADLCVVTVDYGEWRSGPEGAPSPTSADAAPARTATGEPGRGGPPIPRPHEETVRGYAHHVRQSDVYRHPGRQDLTADVDFRALAVHGGCHGLECLGFVTLAAALGGLGGRAEAERLRALSSSSLDDDMALTVLSGLLDPDGVGGLFKVMIQAA